MEVNKEVMSGGVMIGRKQIGGRRNSEICPGACAIEAIFERVLRLVREDSGYNISKKFAHNFFVTLVGYFDEAVGGCWIERINIALVIIPRYSAGDFKVGEPFLRARR